MKECKNCNGMELQLDETCAVCGRDQHQKMSLEEYTKEVDKIAMDKYIISYTGEEGDDCPILRETHEMGDETPEEFVLAWAKKYDLIEDLS